MRGRVSPYPIVLKRKQRKRLQAVGRRRTGSQWLVERAEIILLSDEGLGIEEIAEFLGVDGQRVRRWRVRYLADGMDGLKDEPRSGRPAKYKPKIWQKIATLVVQPPQNFGVELAHWSVREIASFLKKRYGWTVSKSAISRFLAKMALKPHRIQYWLNPTDPDFDAKAAKICQIYLKPPPKTTVLCLDEKPGVQVKSRRHPDRPMQPGRPRRAEFEYKRHGTRCVFAAFNIRNGRVLLRVYRDRKIPRVIDFLDLVCAAYPRGKLLIITDNINTRKGEDAKAWLKRHPRVSFVFTPYHGSWLNQVEIWFSILTRKCLRHRSFDTPRKLASTVRKFTRRWNCELAGPFNWTYTGKVLHA